MGWARSKGIALADPPIPTLGRPGNIHDPNTPLTSDIIDSLGGFSGQPSKSGQKVDEKTATQSLIALLVCKRILSTKIAELDAYVTKRSGRELINLWQNPNPTWSKV